MAFKKGHPFYGNGAGQFKKGQKPWNFKGEINRHGYIAVYKPEHPFSQKQGYVYKHRLVMEEKIGRYLKKGEVVHHIDDNAANNSPDNLKLYSSHGQHTNEAHPEVRMKSSLANKGKRRSPGTEFKKGSIPWNKK